MVFFKKSIIIKTETKDEIKPFLDIIPPHKKVVLYINATPEKRLSKVDILVQLNLKENLRIERLRNRINDLDKLKERIDFNKLTYNEKIKYGHIIHANMNNDHLKM